MPFRIAHSARSSVADSIRPEGFQAASWEIRVCTERPSPKLRVPLGMSRMHSPVPVEGKMANALFREVPEDNEEEEEEEDETEDDDGNDEQEEQEGYSE